MAIPLGDDDDELYRPLAEINVTPLVDVMLVLLIIFMVTAPLLSAGVKINLPAAASARPLDNKALEVGVDRDGAYWLGAERVELDALADGGEGEIGRRYGAPGAHPRRQGRRVRPGCRRPRSPVAQRRSAHRDRRPAAVRGQGQDAAMKAHGRICAALVAAGGALRRAGAAWVRRLAVRGDSGEPRLSAGRDRGHGGPAGRCVRGSPPERRVLA